MLEDRKQRPVHRRLRSLATALALLAIGAVVATGVGYVRAQRGQANLERWHRERPAGELGEPGGLPAGELMDLDAYLALEERLFAEMAAWTSAGAGASGVSRYRRGGPGDPSGFARNWNRTRWLPAAGEERGAALLLHGLSDAPYSLHAIGEALARGGFAVLSLRLPGHGTVPAALTRTGVDEWRAAVRAGARAVARRAAGRPWAIVGYSNGAALALDHSLAALDDPELPQPDRLVFLSPAFAVSRLAGLARWQEALARLPGLEKLAWNSIVAEYDPYKYNSFPLHAGSEIHRLTTELEERLARLAEGGRLTGLPPVLTIQSVVDATVPPRASLERLYLRLPANGSELVLFDVNRQARALGLLRADVDALVESARHEGPYPFSVTLVTDAAGGSDRLEARTRPAGARSAATLEPLPFAWPRGVYSLSHVAIPFPPDDPIYGTGTPHGLFPLGDLEPRGERGTLLVPLDLLLRLRYNPFFPYVERRVGEFLGIAAPMVETTKTTSG